MAQEERSKVDKLDESLYSRSGYRSSSNARSRINPSEDLGVSQDWQGPELEEILSKEREDGAGAGFMKKFFVFALLFFVASIFVAGFVFFGGSNFISSKNVDITVVGPTNTPAGESLELEVSIANDNNASLEFANFSVQYPSGARDTKDSSKSLTFSKQELGAIGAGEEVSRGVEMILIGESGEVKEIKFSIEYGVTGSNATFYKDKSYEVIIGSSPVSLKIEMPESVTAGEKFKTSVTVSHNSQEVLRNIMLRSEYPYGYTVESTVPGTLAGDNVWVLGDLSPGVSKEIEINGRLSGEDRDERTFRFYVGAAEGGNLNPNFKAVIISAQETVILERPAVGVSISFNNESVTSYVAPASGTINTSVRFQNNMRDKLVNPKLEVRFSGVALDESSVSVYNGGFYDSVANKAIWNLKDAKGVGELLPGDNGSVSFSFASLPEVSILGSRDIKLEITLSGYPVGEPILYVKENRSVRISSQVNFSSFVLHSIGPFENTGPLPPKAEKETTYSATFSLGNTRDNLSNAKVTARLGPAVKWLGTTEAGENVVYDEVGGVITWNIGELSSGSGFSGPAREVSFKIGLTPSISQIGIAPVLVSGITFSAYDTFAQKTVTIVNSPLTTALPRDPAFIQGDDIVVK